jgi:5'-nucleotidase
MMMLMMMLYDEQWFDTECHDGTTELFELLPMMENLAVIGVTRPLLLGALENGVSKWPKKDGRFPHVSGLEFHWDPRRAPGARVDATSVRINGAPLDDDESRVYRLCSKEFICTEGKDGYDGFVGCPVLVDAEANPALPTLVQRHCEVVRGGRFRICAGEQCCRRSQGRHCARA